MSRVSREYIEVMDAYNKLYKQDKLRFIMDHLNILNMYDDVITLSTVRDGINQLLMDMTQLTLYKEGEESDE